MERKLIAEPARLDASRPLLRFYQRTDLQKIVRKSGVLGKTRLAVLEKQLPLVDVPRFIAEAGLGTTLVVRHTLRHTAITHLVQAGVDLPTVKRISGHKNLYAYEPFSASSAQIH